MDDEEGRRLILDESVLASMARLLESAPPRPRTVERFDTGPARFVALAERARNLVGKALMMCSSEDGRALVEDAYWPAHRSRTCLPARKCAELPDSLRS